MKQLLESNRLKIQKKTNTEEQETIAYLVACLFTH